MLSHQLFIRNKELLQTFCRYASIMVATPKSSHIMESVNISGSGFQPNYPITLYATLEIPNKGLDLFSLAHIKSSSDGCFDMAKAKSLGGSYSGVDKMGLLWSMSPKSGTRFRLLNLDVFAPINYNVFALSRHTEDFASSQVLAMCNFDKRFAYNNIQRSNVSDGNLKAVLFYPDGPGPFPGIISILGAPGLVEEYAAILANDGFAVLALAAYGLDGLPRYTSDTSSIEYFEEAIDYMLAHEKVLGTGVGLYGHSKGAFLSLACMQYLGTKVTCVVCINGSVSIAVTNISYKDSQLIRHQGGLAFNSGAEMKDYIGVPENNLSHVLQFQHSEADLLMVCGLEDQCVDIEAHVDFAELMMVNAGKTNYKILKYKHLGHLFDPPYSPMNTYYPHPLIPRGELMWYGGYRNQGHANDRIDAWNEIRQFFKEKLS